jgi:uncharacterized protein
LVIYIVEDISPWSMRIADALANVSSFGFVVSELVRMESRVGALRKRNSALDASFEQFFAEHPPVQLGTSVFGRATLLRAESRLATPDALHVACAIEERCDEFWTNDPRLNGQGLPLTIRSLDGN